jgi:hypothetical protein
MAGNARIDQPGEVTFDGQGVAMADSASVESDADLVAAWLG